MTIGIDISALQTGHRMRGIGASLINFINHLPESAKQTHSFVLFLYEDSGSENPLLLLNLTELDYEVRYLRRLPASSLPLPGRLRTVNKLLTGLYGAWLTLFGDRRIRSLRGIDVFLQFDQMQPLPLKLQVRSVLIIYDLIPLIMEVDYLRSYKISRELGYSRKRALLAYLARKTYKRKIKKNTQRARKLLSISEHTKRDFIHYLRVPSRKIEVCLLGVENKDIDADSSPHPSLEEYIDTSWGYLKRPLTLQNRPFLLFVGGADPRRKLADLVAAFNNLRARGHEVDLVFTGDTMLGRKKVPHVELQEYFEQTSYMEYIHFLGFTSDDERNWLYRNALVFVYPSAYEGFGLPVLEAMQYGTPVITYDNSSIKEIAGDAALYANDFKTIATEVEQLLNDASLRKKLAEKGIRQATKFSWAQTSKKIIDSV